MPSLASLLRLFGEASRTTTPLVYIAWGLVREVRNRRMVGQLLIVSVNLFDYPRNSSPDRRHTSPHPEAYKHASPRGQLKLQNGTVSDYSPDGLAVSPVPLR